MIRQEEKLSGMRGILVDVFDSHKYAEAIKSGLKKKWAWGSKIVKIPNGVDVHTFKPLGKKYNHQLKAPVLLSVGALAWYKHHNLTIEAVSRLKDVSLLIVGKGEEEKQLKDQANKLGLAGRFKIISAPFSELDSIYRSADLFALPSWDREAFGIVYRDWETDRKSTRLNSSHEIPSRMPSSA